MDSNQRGGNGRPLEPEFVLQWGKRLRCNRVKNPNLSPSSNAAIRRRILSSSAQPNGFSRGPVFRSPPVESRKSVSPDDKEDRYYATRGSAGGASCSSAVEETRKPVIEDSAASAAAAVVVVEEDKLGNSSNNSSFIWPKLYIALSKKEKEEDFLAMKGCKLPQRPKKRAKFIQRSLLMVSPGAWLSDLCQERYEVREKKTSKKRPRGLKAMGATFESDSE